VSLLAQLIGTVAGVLIALIAGIIVYGLLKLLMGLRLSPEEEFDGADLTIHKITSTPDRESSW
jgi:Amt family ammonium transporter